VIEAVRSREERSIVPFCCCAGFQSTEQRILAKFAVYRPHSVLPDRQSRTTTGLKARHDSVVSKKPTVADSKVKCDPKLTDGALTPGRRKQKESSKATLR
jgi:hypothetical protein